MFAGFCGGGRGDGGSISKACDNVVCMLYVYRAVEDFVTVNCKRDDVRPDESADKSNSKAWRTIAMLLVALVRS